jgi:phage shock protein E
MKLPLLIVTMFSILSLSAADVLVIDVRTQGEWDSGHLENAQHIEWQNILKLSETASKDQEIYLYCRSGNRSGKAAKILNIFVIYILLMFTLHTLMCIMYSN